MKNHEGERKMKKIETAKTLKALGLYTHTHTHTQVFFKNEKIGIYFNKINFAHAKKEWLCAFFVP